MAPYKDNDHLTVSQIRYNMKLNCIRSVIVRSFRWLLKIKFRWLKYLDILDFDLGNKIIAACTLHNFIIDNLNVDDKDYLEEQNLDDRTRRRRITRSSRGCKKAKIHYKSIINKY